MGSVESALNLQKTFKSMEINGQRIICRFCRDGEEEDYIPDPFIRSGKYASSPLTLSMPGKKFRRQHF